MTVEILIGDCRELLATLPDESVHCVVTSPPYFGLRDYGVAGQIGLEASPDEFVAAMVAVFREVRRVLRADGTLWLNLGDSYAATHQGNHGTKHSDAFHDTGRAYTENVAVRRGKGVPSGLKPKDLLMIPARVALALQADGWWLRKDIIWHKPNPMPESVTDRPTSSHEHVFLMTKAPRYFYDAEAVREPDAGQDHTRQIHEAVDTSGGHLSPHTGIRTAVGRNGAGRNLRDVWTIATAPFSEAHFATFPPALVEPCIRAGTSERGCCPACGAPWVRQVNRRRLLDGETPVEGGWSRNDAGQIGADGKRHGRVTTSSETTGWSPSCECGETFCTACDDRCSEAHDTEICRGSIVGRPPSPIPCTVLDPFGGAGTVGLVADRMQRNAILIELNPEYAAMARRRITNDAPLFAAAQ